MQPLPQSIGGVHYRLLATAAAELPAAVAEASQQEGSRRTRSGADAVGGEIRRERLPAAQEQIRKVLGAD